MGKPVAEMDIPKMTKHVREDIRRMYLFANRMEEEETDWGYIPGLYVKTGWEPPIANKEVEERLKILKEKSNA